MTDEDYQAIFQQLSTMLRELGYGWIAEQVDDQVAAGMLDEFPGESNSGWSEFHISQVNLASARAISKDKDRAFVLREYTEREKAEALITAIRHVVSSGIAIAAHLAGFAGEFELPPRIKFGDAEQGEQGVIQITEQHLGDWNTNATALTNALDQLGERMRSNG